ncbi:MAG: LLM class flavin-dependent oxidoreductase, partial [Chloroflexi bacterium]|nr:LLM class flavin-dependent oxidoreductase [Chloroflexota bacterium]
MRFGTILHWHNDYGGFQGFVRRLRLADCLGYDFICVGDSQSNYHELYGCLTVAAMQTSNAMIGSMVTNPITRHPAVTASGIATVDEVSGGRAMLGIGIGGGAILNIGEQRATLDHIRDYIVALRSLLQGKSATWRGKSCHTRWVKRPVPVYLSAYGPKTARLAGAVADGVIIGTSAQPNILRERVELVRQGAVEAGRDPATIDTMVMVRGAVGNSRAEAIVGLRANLASGGKNIRIGDKYLPRELEPKIRELQRRYVATESAMWNGKNAILIDELGLTDYLADRYSIAGTPEE